MGGGGAGGSGGDRCNRPGTEWFLYTIQCKIHLYSCNTS